MKRFLTADDVADIARRYEAGETTQQIGDRFGISKTRVATVLHEQGVAIRRQGLNEEQVSGVVMLYAAGRSLGWLAAQYGISPTTVSRALQHHGVTIRPRPGRRAIDTTGFGDDIDQNYVRFFTASRAAQRITE